ncbi:uncharacterized protein LOC135692062 [Rhopilema esculentum]|uniref:uncharacterized protein LOC135692062 n=1 Tax=Rhopilema esculentum TaxID=499914 RepID=UPI0031D2B8EF
MDDALSKENLRQNFLIIAAGEALNVSDNTSIVGENTPDESKRLETKKQETEREQQGVKSKKVGGFVSRFRDTKEVENSVACEVDKKLKTAKQKRRKLDKEKRELNKDLEAGGVKIDDGRSGNKKKKKFGENENSGRGNTEKDGATEVGKCIESGENKDGTLGDVDASFEKVKQGKRKLDSNENRQKMKRGKKKRVETEIDTETKEKVKVFEESEDALGSVKQMLSSEEAKKLSEKIAKGGLNAKDKKTKKKKLKIEENSKRKEKGVKKAKTHVDKRSGVVSVEIVRPVSRKMKTNVVIDTKGNYDFGAGESEGW